MVYGYKPETVKAAKGLKLIEPQIVPKGDQITLELQDPTKGGQTGKQKNARTGNKKVLQASK